jgi:hypothetical protein
LDAKKKRDMELSNDELQTNTEEFETFVFPSGQEIERTNILLPFVVYWLHDD